MDKAEMQAFLDQQVSGLTDFSNGFKACAKAVMGAYDSKKETASGTGTENNDATAPAA